MDYTFEVEFIDGRVEPVVDIGQAESLPTGVTLVSFRTFSGVEYKYEEKLYIKEFTIVPNEFRMEPVIKRMVSFYKMSDSSNQYVKTDEIKAIRVMSKDGGFIGYIKTS